MQANSLMIGDWVYDEHGYTRKVNAIWDNTVVLAECKLNANTIIAQSRHYISDITSIPLTPEILEKNGCTMVDKGDYGEWHIKENPNIPLWQHTEFIIFGGIEIHYVHELQHALRLCGLNELADNFKI